MDPSPDFAAPATVPVEEIDARIRRFQGHLCDLGLGGALLLPEIDRYYFTGTVQHGFVLVPAEGEPLLLMRKDAGRAAEESALPVKEIGSMRDLRAQVEVTFGEVPAPLGIAMDAVPAAQAKLMGNIFDGVEVADATRAVMLTRGVKSPWEVEKIRAAANMVAEAVALVPTFLREGMPEVELAARVEFELRRRGHGGFTPMRAFNQRLFYGHIMAGAGAATPGGYDMPTTGAGMSAAVGQGASGRAIRAGEPVVVDVVGHYEGYLCDQTRLFSVGPIDAPFAEVFEAAVAVQRAVVAAAMPGAKASELYAVSQAAAADTPFADHYLGDGNKVGFVGHGIGLELDEYPFLTRAFDLELVEGMVFALEPKFIFQGRGVAGIEDTYVVLEGGAERLTSSPQELVIV